MSNLSQRVADLSPEKLKLLARRLSKKQEDDYSGQSIKPQSRTSNSFPLSFAQQRLWFIDQLQPGNIAYNIYQPIRLAGHLSIEALHQSLNEVVRRHDVLRTTFITEDGKPTQIIAENLTINPPIVDLQDLPIREREREVLRLVNEEPQRPFDLTKGPLLRVSLLKLAAAEYALLFTIHHIVADAWSIGIFINELAVLYKAFSCKKTSPLPKLPIQYVDYAVWEQQQLQGKALETQLEYWRRCLGGKLPVLNLPTAGPRAEVQTFRGATCRFDLSPNLYQALKKLSHQANVTLFTTLLTALVTLLYRHTNQDDIVVGTNVSNRSQSEIQGLIGFFVNILVLRTDLSGNPSFRELLSRVREVVLGAYDHQSLPFAKLVEELQPERQLNQAPMFEVLFVMENASLNQKKLEIPGLSLKRLRTDHENAKFDLALFIEETEQGLVGNYWHYNAALFDTITIEQMSKQFEILLDSIVAQPDARISNLEILTQAEKKKQATTEAKQEEIKFKKFKDFKPKKVKIQQRQLIKTDYLFSEEKIPWTLRPTVSELDLADWVMNKRESIETDLQKHGAILFRRFKTSEVSEFEKVASAICPKLFGNYGDLPREGISNKVYGSTPYPSNQAILFHNESSHLHQWPLKIWFFCVQPAQEGGETPIVDCRKVYQLLDPKLRERFEQKQLMYVRNYIEGLDVSWQDFFHTTDKAVVESYCYQSGIDCQWLSENQLRTRKVRPAISKHPKTGELVFFNQVQLHHASCLEPAVRASLLSTLGEDNLPRNVYYGDGSPIEDSVMSEIGEIYERAKVSFPWEQGDILMLDNMLIAHGRNPYVGSRKTLVAMGEMIKHFG